MKFHSNFDRKKKIFKVSIFKTVWNCFSHWNPLFSKSSLCWKKFTKIRNSPHRIEWIMKITQRYCSQFYRTYTHTLRESAHENELSAVTWWTWIDRICIEWKNNGLCHRFACSMVSSENPKFQTIFALLQYKSANQSKDKQWTEILVVFTKRKCCCRSIFKMATVNLSDCIQSEKD